MADLTVSLAGTPVAVYLGDNVSIASARAAAAEASADAAALSAATAEAAAGPTYADTATGLAATVSGEAFAVDNGDGTVTVYLNSAGVAVAQRTLATTAALASPGGSGMVDGTKDAVGAAPRTAKDQLDRIWSPADFSGTDTEKLQAFFDYIGTNNVEQAELTGEFSIDAPITISGGATRTIRCNVEITAVAAMDEMLVLDNLQFQVFEGRVKLTGTGGADISTRTVDRAIRLAVAPRAHFTMLELTYFRKWGIYSPDGVNNNGIKVDKMRAEYIGTYSTGTASISATFTSNTQTGSSQSTGQRSVLGGLSNIPADISAADQDWVIIDGDPYLITAVDTAAGTVTVYPWVPNTTTSGTVRYVFGSPVGMFGGDAGVSEIKQLTALHSGIGWHDRALYPGKLDNAIIQACTFGMTLGNGVNSTSFAPKAIGTYMELNEFDFVQSSNIIYNGLIAGDSYVPGDRTWHKLAPRTAVGVDLASQKMFGGVGFQHGGRFFRQLGNPGGNATASAQTLTLDQCSDEAPVFRENTKTLTLTGNAFLNSGFGATYMRVVCFGSGANKNPTGNYTVQAGTVDSVAGTINGAASQVFASTIGPFILHCYWQVATNNWVVQQEVIPAAASQTYTATNVTTDRSFDADTATVAEIADVLGTLISDLRAKGVVL